jgi:glycerol-3-phosphate O-acyltransferase 3/4
MMPHVYVANHTSFIDYIVLSSHEYSHACVSESHGGLFGLIFKYVLLRSISFKRSEKQVREVVLRKMREHVEKRRAPMLIFPEGTCVNNKYTVLFQKGAFELDVPVFPVAIKWGRSLLDPYWNRRKQTFIEHLLYLMTRWRLDADVYWMDPVWRKEGEGSFEFSHRVKELISNRAGLKSVLWNGYFKSSPMLKDR